MDGDSLFSERETERLERGCPGFWPPIYSGMMLGEEGAAVL